MRHDRMTRTSADLDPRRRRILFRCWHRGIREMDLMLGQFADAEIGDLPDERSRRTGNDHGRGRQRPGQMDHRRPSRCPNATRRRSLSKIAAYRPDFDRTMRQTHGRIARHDCRFRCQEDSARNGRELTHRQCAAGMEPLHPGRTCPRRHAGRLCRVRRPAHGRSRADAGLCGTRYPGADAARLGLPAL